MRITKIGHCCLLIELEGVCLLTDPGNLSSAQDELSGLHAVLITHEHADHLHVDSLKRLLAGNPGIPVLANRAVADILVKEGLPFTVVEDRQRQAVGEVTVEGFEAPHVEIYRTLPRVANTGFLVGGHLFYPGDAFIVPGVPVEVLALPVAGPWLKSSEAIDYALQLRPQACFPVHDGFLAQPEFFHRLPELVLKPAGIDFRSLRSGEQIEF